MPDKKYDAEWYTEKYKLSIKFKISEKYGIEILDSYEIKDDLVKMMFLNDIMETYDFGKRNMHSLFTEWKAHNILYNKKLFRKRTADTGLNPKESWIRRLYYRFVCFLFSEK